MTAAAPTLEEELHQRQQNEIAQFVMPRPCVGQSVTYYPHANPASHELAFVLKVEHRCVWVQRASGIAVQTVRHMADPKLQLNEHQRLSGAWDFTERDRQLDALADYETRMRELTQRVTAVENKLARHAERFDKAEKKAAS